MNTEKFEKAKELSEGIEVLTEKINRIERASRRKETLIFTNYDSDAIAIPNKHKEIILNLAKSLIETDLKELQAEFDAL